MWRDVFMHEQNDKLIGCVRGETNTLVKNCQVASSNNSLKRRVSMSYRKPS